MSDECSIYLSDYKKRDLVNGPGIRFSIYVSGCRWNCEGCFNTATHNFNFGLPFDEAYQDKVITDIKEFPYGSNLTVLGGDSFFSSPDMVKFIKRAKREIPDLNIWAWTGFTYEGLTSKYNVDNYSSFFEYLTYVDVLIDGKFKEDEKDLTLRFRGSKNQRIIDVQKSLASEEVVLWRNGDY